MIYCHYMTPLSLKKLKRLYLLITILLISVSARAQFGIINTIAGNGTAAYTGDGGPATSASLNTPLGIWVDGTGNLYIADKGNSVIRKVTTAGIISTIAGTGVAGYSGDLGAATLAQLSSPTGVSVDASGNVYIADFGNNRIRMINALGVISTVAGNGTAGFTGDGSAATSAELHSPYGVWVEAGSSFVFTDQANHRVRKVNGTTGIITTIAGNGGTSFCCDGGPATAASFTNPAGICEDATGVIYFATQAGDARVRKIDLAGNIYTEMGNGVHGFTGDCGPATNAEILLPQGVATDAANNVYLATSGDYRIRVVDAATGVIHTVAGDGSVTYSGDGGSPLSAGMNPFGVFLDATGDVYISGDNRVRKITIASTNDTVRFCPGDSVVLGSATSFVDSFKWSSGDTTSSITVHTGGTYWVNMYICAFISTDTFIVKTDTPLIVAGSNSPVCSGNTISLTATPDTAGETFSWIGPGGFSSTLQNPAISGVPITDSGIYKVIIVVNGCIDSAFVHVHIDQSPATPVAGSNSPLCTNDTVKLTGADVTSSISYHWSGPSSFNSSNQNPVINNASATQSGMYTLTVTSGLCSSTDSTLVIVNPKPPIPELSPILPHCSGTTLAFTVIADTVGATYLWSGPNGYSSILENPAIPNIVTADGGVYSVTATLLGCSSTYTVNVTVDSTPVAPTASSNSPVCSGNTLFLTSFSPTAGATYSWAGPGTYTATSQDTSIINTITPESGNYTVTATSHYTSLNCSNSGVTPVVINQTPGLPTATSNSPVCTGGLLAFTSVATPGSGTYYWSGPNIFTSTIENPQINNVTIDAAGVYAVYETLNGCTSPTAYDTVTVVQSPATPVVSSNSPVCEGNTLMLYAIDTSSGITYNWSGPSSFAATDANPLIDNAAVSAGGLYLLTVSQGICTATATTNVVVTPRPAFTCGNNGPICQGDTLKIFAIGDPAYVYSWTGPYGYSSIGTNQTIYPTIVEYAGIYTVTATTSAATGSCSNAIFDTAVINPTPQPTWISWLTYCQYYNAPPLQAIDATNVLWYPSAAAGSIGTSIPPIPPTDIPGTFYYYLNQTVNGCPSAIDSIQVTVNPKPTVSVSPTESSICPHDSVVLTATDPDPLDVYHWYPNTWLNYDTLNSVTTAHPITDENYLVVVTNHFNCTDTAFSTIHVYPSGVIFLGPTDSITLHAGDSYNIEPTTNCISFNWFPPLGLSSNNISNPVASPVTNTMYVVQGATENGCYVADSIYFTIADETVIAVPNAFTPGTGINNTFKLLKDGLATLNYFRIFDRWGVLVFETNNIDNGWDGNYKGQPQPMGVYVYEFQAVATATGKLVTQHGNITLLR